MSTGERTSDNPNGRLPRLLVVFARPRRPPARSTIRDPAIRPHRLTVAGRTFYPALCAWPHRLTRLGHRVFIPAMRVQIPLGSFESRTLRSQSSCRCVRSVKRFASTKRPRMLSQQAGHSRGRRLASSAAARCALRRRTGAALVSRCIPAATSVDSTTAYRFGPTHLAGGPHSRFGVVHRRFRSSPAPRPLSSKLRRRSRGERGRVRAGRSAIAVRPPTGVRSALRGIRGPGGRVFSAARAPRG